MTTRRSILKASAWVVPAITFAGAAPAYAISAAPGAPVCIPVIVKKVKAGETKVNTGKNAKKEARDTVKATFGRGTYKDIQVLFNGVPGYSYFGEGFISSIKQGKKTTIVEIISCGMVVWSGRIGYEC